MRLLVAISAGVALLLLAMPGPAIALTPNVGQHIHVEVTNHPVDGYPIPRSVYTFHVIVKLHNQTGATSYIRLDDEHGTIRAQRPLVLGPCADCTTAFDWNVDFGSWPAGRNEIRWHVDVPKNNDGNRQFTTSRAQICLVNCGGAASDRPVPFNGGSSWYLGHYATFYLISKETDIKPGGSVTVRTAQDARRTCAFLNPDFHNGSSGTALGCSTGTHTYPIPSTAVAGDRLLLFADEADGNAGLQRYIVGDGTVGPTADYEWQSWWAKGGVVFP